MPQKRRRDSKSSPHLEPFVGGSPVRSGVKQVVLAMAGEGTEERRALTILWRIENFSYCKHGLHGNEIHTTLFEPRTLNGRLCCLQLFPNGELVSDIQLSLRLYLPGKALDYPIDCEWSFLDSDGSPLVSWTVRNYIQSDKALDLPDCPTPEELFQTRKSSYLPHDTLTVRCRIWKSQGEFAQAEHFSLLSRLEGSEHSFWWPIEGFSTLQLGQNVTTQVVLPLPTLFGKKDVQVKFSLKGASLLDSMVGCEVTKNVTSGPVLKVKMSVLDNGQKAIKCWEKNLEFSYSNPKFVSRKELLEKKSECLGGDVLNLLCVLAYIRKGYYNIIQRSYLGPTNLEQELPRKNVIPVSEASCQTSQQNVDPTDISQERSFVTLGEDFLSLYSDQSFSDFELRSGDVSFPVHKNVLCARSPVFRAMFSSDMKESDSNFLDVPDVDAHALNRMLIFLYAGTVELLQFEGAIKLYYAADKYQIPSLKQQCSSFLRSRITVSNVSDILTLADRHGDQELTSLVHDFSLRNYDEIMQSDEWESFLENDSYFAGKTMHQLYKKKLQLKNH